MQSGLRLLRNLIGAFAVALWSPAIGATTNVGPAAPSLDEIVTVPIVDFVDESPVIQVYINNKGPFRFKFDSASCDLVNGATASALGLSISGRADVDEIAGPIPSTTSSVDLRIAGGQSLKTTIYVMPDSWHDNPTINGWLGKGLLDRYTVTLDMPHRRMILAPSGAYTPPAGSTVLPMTGAGGPYAVPARIDGLSGTFAIDTGARVHVLLSAAFQQTPGFEREYSSRGLAGELGGPSGKKAPIRALPGHVLEIGDQQIADPLIVLLERDDLPQLHGLSGLIGLHALQQFEITFDVAGSRFVLSNRQPSNIVHRGIGFDTEYSAGATWIRRVVRGSPAWAAGLRDGDRVLEVDHEPIDHVSSKAWGSLWQETDGAVVNLVAQQGTSAPRRLNIVLKAWKEQF